MIKYIKKSQSSQSTLPVSEVFNDPVADVEITSSDNVVHRVTGFYLMSAR